MIKKIILCFLFFIPPVFAIDTDLKFVAVLIRHGDRTTLHNIPTSPKQCQTVTGQLTGMGMKEEYELGKKFRKLVTVEAGSYSVRLVELDHDTFPEIEFWDGSIDYLFACFAGSVPGRVVLKFQKNHFC